MGLPPATSLTPLNPLPYKVYLAFDGAAVESVWATFELPADYDSGDVTVYIWTERPSLYTNVDRDTRWGFDAYIAQRPAVGAGNAIGIPAQNSEVTITHPARTDRYVNTAYGISWRIYTGWRYAQRDSLGTFTPNAAGDLCKVKIYRDPTHVDDTYAGDMALFMVEFSYTADS